MTKKPIILCTRSFIDSNAKIMRVALNRAYADAIECSGGILLMVTTKISANDIDGLLDQVDGVLIPGGADLNPAIYNEDRKEYSQNPDDERDEIEQNIIKSAITKKLPILAICRGCQILNVTLGGTLYQDIEKEKENPIKHDYHNDGPRSFVAHAVTLNDDSLISKIIGEKTVEVNSLHHQGIKQIGKDLIISAKAPDGLIEGIEILDYAFGIGLQWHPEELEDPIWKKLFDAFIKECLKKSVL